MAWLLIRKLRTCSIFPNSASVCSRSCISHCPQSIIIEYLVECHHHIRNICCKNIEKIREKQLPVVKRGCFWSFLIKTGTACCKSLIEINHLAHQGDIPFELSAIEGCALAVHPAEFLKFLAKGVVVNPALLIPLSTPVNRGYGVSQGASTNI